MTTKHFLTLNDLSKNDALSIFDKAIELKKSSHSGQYSEVLKGKTLAMIFEKSSTRTRVSFEAGMAQLGGSAIFLSTNDTQLGRGEPLEDSARVISRMVDIILIRTFSHANIEQFAKFSSVPVINALSDEFHPCQLLADILTFIEYRGPIEDKVVAWIGDGNNMCQSWINAATLFDFHLNIACPEGYEPSNELLQRAGPRVKLFRDPKEASTKASLVTTDVFTSMGQEKEREVRLEKFRAFRVDHELMSVASENAIFMHCLPAHRNEEVSTELIEDENVSVVWDQAENRLHAQKALMLFLLGQKITQI